MPVAIQAAVDEVFHMPCPGIFVPRLQGPRRRDHGFAAATPRAVSGEPVEDGRVAPVLLAGDEEQPLLHDRDPDAGDLAMLLAGLNHDPVSLGGQTSLPGPDDVLHRLSFGLLWRRTKSPDGHQGGCRCSFHHPASPWSFRRDWRASILGVNNDILWDDSH
jgi:hypothetical protein